MNLNRLSDYLGRIERRLRVLTISQGAAAIFAAAMRVRTRVAASLARLGDCKLLKMLFMFVFLYSAL